MKKIFIIISITIAVLFNSCSSNRNKEYDTIIFTKGTFRIAEKYQDNFPDSLFGKSPDLYTEYFPRSIITLKNGEIFLYLNEYGNKNKGYFKANLSKNIEEDYDTLISKVDFKDIVDSSLLYKMDNVIYDGYAYFLFLIKDTRVQTINFIDMEYYKKDFMRFINFLDSIDNKTQITRLYDSLKLKNDYDTLKISIVRSIKDKIPPLRSIKKFLK